MDPQVQKRLFKLTPKKIVTVTLLTFLLLVLAVSAQLIYTVLKYDKVYKGVYVDGIYASGMSTEELKDLLNKNYEDKVNNSQVTLNIGKNSEKIGFSDINVVYNVQDAVDKAYNIGRTGNVFERVYDIVETSFNSKKVELTSSYNKEKLQQIINSLYEKTLVKVKEADLSIQSDRVVIRSGHHGENIDKDKVLAEIENSIKECKSEAINVPVIETAPSRINVDEYIKKINVEASDASIKIENNSIRITPHVVGKNVDKTTFVNIVSELGKTEDTEKVLPVISVQPKVRTEDIHVKLFKDTLASSSTQFYTNSQNDTNRAGNIRIAVSKINGKMLAPGEVFSFNDTVGARTEDGGYKEAFTYVGGKVIPGVGGGICQVSSTLYNSVLFADLEVDERINHMFTITYVPLGRDAAVAYGSADFKFKNSTNWPIKIESWVSKDNKIYFVIKGTNETPGKTVEIIHKTIKETDYTTKFIDDPTLDEGQTVEKQHGGKGVVVDTYKIVKQDGKVVSEVKLHTSVYKPLEREIRKGTRKPQTAAAQTQPQPAKPQAPAESPPELPAQPTAQQ